MINLSRFATELLHADPEQAFAFYKAAKAHVDEQCSLAAKKGAKVEGQKVHRTCYPRPDGKGATACGQGKWATTVVDDVTCGRCLHSNFALKLERLLKNCRHCFDSGTIRCWHVDGEPAGWGDERSAFGDVPCPYCA